MKKVVYVLFLFVSVSFAQDLKWDSSALINADFTIDAVHTKDGVNYELSATGEAGPYGRVYLSYVFTNHNDSMESGEFTGFIWTQMEEEIIKGTTQGVYRKQGKVFKMYALDNLTNEKTYIVSGIADFVNKTLKFKASEVKE
jgi:hypothetical protein